MDDFVKEIHVFLKINYNIMLEVINIKYKHKTGYICMYVLL